MSVVKNKRSLSRLEFYNTARKLRIKYYGRYMDDTYLIHKDKKFLEYCLE